MPRCPQRERPLRCLPHKRKIPLVVCDGTTGYHQGGICPDSPATIPSKVSISCLVTAHGAMHQRELTGGKNTPTSSTYSGFPITNWLPATSSVVSNFTVRQHRRRPHTRRRHRLPTARQSTLSLDPPCPDSLSAIRQLFMVNGPSQYTPPPAPPFPPFPGSGRSGS